MATLSEKLKIGLKYHRSGQLGRAEDIYRQILRTDPNHCDSLHLLGVLAQQTGRHQLAVDYIGRAVAQRPRMADYLGNLGAAYRSLGRCSQAVKTLKRALRIDPNHLAVRLNLGNALTEQGKLDEAIICFRRALKLQPQDANALNSLGAVLVEQGKHAEAEDTFRRVLQIAPDHAGIYRNLGLVLAAQAKFEQAANCYRHALQSQPESADVHNRLAEACVQLKQFDEAWDHFQRAVQLQPDNADALNNLGAILVRRGEHAEAEAIFRRVLKIAPDHARAHGNLGLMLAEQGKFDEAVGCYRRALQLQPDSADVHGKLALAYLEQERFDRAQEHSDRAVQLQPDHADSLKSLGIVLAKRGKYEEAEATFRRVLEIAPDCSAARLDLALLFLEQRRIDEAITLIQETIDLDPTYAAAWYQLANVTRNTDVDPARIEQAEEILANCTLRPKERRDLHFALGKMGDDRKEWDRAFVHYRQANQLVNVDFDEAQFVKPIDALIENFSAAFLHQAPVSSRDSDLPILIVGMPRSGTTLVEQILSSHPQVHGAGELDEMMRISEAVPSLIQSDLPFPHNIERIDRAMADDLADRYLGRLEQLGPNATRVTDKMPFNFHNLGLISILLPRAKIIHCRRHPLDVCISCYFQNFHRHISFAYDLESLGICYRHYHRLMEHWRTALPRPFFELDYEKLVQEQEEVSRELVEFCGLDWHPGCLQFHTNSRSVRTASKWQVRQPIYQQSMHRWRNYDKFLGPLKESLGELLELHRADE